MSNEEYEDAYREALLLVSQQGHSVSEPVQVDSTRVVEINGELLNDIEVLTLGWGPKVARLIKRERTANRKKPTMPDA